MGYLQKIGESVHRNLMEIQFRKAQRKVANEEAATRSQAEIPALAREARDLITIVEAHADRKWALALLSAVLQILNRAVSSQNNR
jgi:hypothetical protein